MLSPRLQEAVYSIDEAVSHLHEKTEGPLRLVHRDHRLVDRPLAIDDQPLDFLRGFGLIAVYILEELGQGCGETLAAPPDQLRSESRASRTSTSRARLQSASTTPNT